jgi:hypothetical protein
MSLDNINLFGTVSVDRCRATKRHRFVPVKLNSCPEALLHNGWRVSARMHSHMVRNHYIRKYFQYGTKLIGVDRLEFRMVATPVCHGHIE